MSGTVLGNMIGLDRDRAWRQAVAEGKIIAVTEVSMGHSAHCVASNPDNGPRLPPL